MNKYNIYIPILYFIIHIVVYWFMSALFYLVDNHLNCRRYKIQKLDQSKKYTLSTCKIIIFNHLCIMLPMLFIYHRIYDYIGIPKDISLSEKQSNFIYTYIGNYYPSTLNICIGQIFIAFILHEIQFYWSHRLLHTSLLYPYVHKIHHEFVSPIALAAQYMHPIEFMILFFQITNVTILVGMHPITVCIWITLANLLNITSHSGYKFPFYDNDYHDYHHSSHKYNYGSLSISDDLFGTNWVKK